MVKILPLVIGGLLIMGFCTLMGIWIDYMLGTKCFYYVGVCGGFFVFLAMIRCSEDMK